MEFKFVSGKEKKNKMGETVENKEMICKNFFVFL